MCTSTSNKHLEINEELKMTNTIYPIYNEDTGTYSVELYDNASLVADVKYYKVFANSPLPVGEFEGIVEIDDTEYVYVINHIVENYEDDNGESLKLIHRHCFDEPLEEYGLSMDDIDDIVEALIITEEEL